MLIKKPFKKGAGGSLAAFYKTPAGGTPFSITHTDNAQDTSGTTTYTWTSRNFAIGTADASRLVAVVLVARGLSTLGSASSVTIGGVSATVVKVQNTQLDGNSLITEIWQAAVPTGTTATISAVYPSAMLRAGASVRSILGSNGSVPTGGAINSAQGGGVASVNAAITVPTGGGAIIGTANVNTTTVTPTNYTEDVDTVIASSTAYETGTDTAHSGSTTYTATFGVGSATGNIVMAAWGP